MNWGLLVDEKVTKQLKRFPRNESGRLLMAINQLPLNPYVGDIEKMKGEDHVWRRRVGSYRIKYEIYTARKIVRVFSVERRTSATY